MDVNKTIIYGGGSSMVSGPVYDEYMEVFGSNQVKAHLPIILKRMFSDSSAKYSKYQGILGLSPNDESSGPLLVDSLYDQ